jgi:hypothetical protein
VILAAASEACGVHAAVIPAKELTAYAGAALGLAEAKLANAVAALGKTAGKPWTQDQKQCALAAWAALG